MRSNGMESIDERSTSRDDAPLAFLRRTRTMSHSNASFAIARVRASNASTSRGDGARASAGGARARERDASRRRSRAHGDGDGRRGMSTHATSRDVVARTRDVRDYWFPVAFARAFAEKANKATFDLFDVPWVLFRGANGGLACVKDECAHRACPLSLGKVVDGRIQCPYHGWEYDASGACVKMPSCKFLKDVVVKGLRVIERDGMVFVWPGESDPADFIGVDGERMAASGAAASWDEDVYETNGPGMFTPRKGFVTMAEVTADVELDSQVVVERLLDITERARREPVGLRNRGATRYEAIDATKAISRVLRVGYSPVPQAVVFKPSCVISSTIALKPRIGGDSAEPMGCVEQLHVCLPTKPGSTRVLFRMAFDFVPSGAENAAGDVWKNLAIQVLQEQLEDVRDRSLKSETTSTAADSFRLFRAQAR